MKKDKKLYALIFTLVALFFFLLFEINKNNLDKKIELDLSSNGKLTPQYSSESIKEETRDLNLNDYELIGLIYSNNPEKSQAIIRIKKENIKNYKENEVIDAYIKLTRIQTESVLVQKINDQSITKELKLKEPEINNYNLNQSVKKESIDNYENPSKAKYMEDAFRESYLKIEK